MAHKEKHQHVFAHLWSMGLVCMLFSVFLLPNQERFFPLSRYAMFANTRPPLEPLPFLEVDLENGSTERVDIRLWSPGGVSNGRNLLQSLLGKRRQEKHKICIMLAQKIAPHFVHPSKANQLHIVGGQFDVHDVVRQGTIKPVHAKRMYSCSILDAYRQERVP